MNLQYRIDLLSRLGEYILSDDETWQQAKADATHENGWFIPEFVDIAIRHIALSFLQREVLKKWTASYALPSENPAPKTIGIVMAGNIPLVGFHDFLCTFITGHRSRVKASSKDSALIKQLTAKLAEWDEATRDYVVFADRLQGCDAYIATGSNNTAGYFEYYFGKYPHIIRRNRTSVAVLTGDETKEELGQLADDVFLYFGLGCRNVTKIYVPVNYDFVPLLEAFKKYDWLAENHKYKNNYDYNLAIHILNKKFYMSTPALLLVEDNSFFSPISQLNYEFYTATENLTESLKNKTELQCLVGRDYAPFGMAQYPSISDYADAVDTILFLKNL